MVQDRSQSTSQDSSADTQLSDKPLNAAARQESDDQPPEGASDNTDAQRGLNPFQVVSSVFAAGLGVQSSKNRERDFKQGRAGTFIVAGLLFTALFIGTVYTIVTLVLSNR
jgi:hypothetical protein